MDIQALLRNKFVNIFYIRYYNIVYRTPRRWREKYRKFYFTDNFLFFAMFQLTPLSIENHKQETLGPNNFYMATSRKGRLDLRLDFF